MPKLPLASAPSQEPAPTCECHFSSEPYHDKLLDLFVNHIDELVDLTTILRDAGEDEDFVFFVAEHGDRWGWHPGRAQVALDLRDLALAREERAKRLQIEAFETEIRLHSLRNERTRLVNER